MDKNDWWFTIKIIFNRHVKKLLDNYDESYVSYCLVPILLNIAINHPKLSVDDRIYILKSLFTCFILYQRTLIINS